MNDIKITSTQMKRGEFTAQPLGAHGATIQAQKSPEPTDKVKVKFEKFVKLVATHDFAEVMKRYADEDLILSTNLLTDLANAHEETPEPRSRMPVFLIIGILIGVVVTYLIIRF